MVEDVDVDAQLLLCGGFVLRHRRKASGGTPSPIANLINEYEGGVLELRVHVAEKILDTDFLAQNRYSGNICL